MHGEEEEEEEGRMAACGLGAYQITEQRDQMQKNSREAARTEGQQLEASNPYFNKLSDLLLQ